MGINIDIYNLIRVKYTHELQVLDLSNGVGVGVGIGIGLGLRHISEGCFKTTKVKSIKVYRAM